jgi:nickel transport protein
LFFVLLTGTFLWATRPARAHKLKVFATAEGRNIRGYAYFPGGGRAANVPVEVLGPEGRKLGEIKTDQQGRFAYKAEARCDHRFVVNTGAGHRASYTVGAHELPVDLPAVGKATPDDSAPQDVPVEEPAGSPPPAIEHEDLTNTIERAVSRQLRPLREDLETYHSRARLHEIIGGIGYIVGIMGLVFFLKGRSLRTKEN